MPGQLVAPAWHVALQLCQGTELDPGWVSQQHSLEPLLSPVLWEFPPQLCPSGWRELLGPSRWHPRGWHCSGSQTQSGTWVFDGLVCGTMAGPPLVLPFLSIPGLHTAGTRLAHPCGCRIDQLNAELMMREAEPGALGTLQRPLVFLVLQLPGGFKLPTSMSWAPCVCHAPAVAASPPTAGACAAGAHAPGVHTASAHIPEGCREHLPMGAEFSAPSSPRGECCCFLHGR